VAKSKIKRSKNKINKRKRTVQKSEQKDILQLLMDDHKPLKKWIGIMKDTDNDLDQRQEALEQFGPLLLSHAKPEQESLYNFMRDIDSIRTEAFEGDVEHALAEQVLQEVMETEDEDLWSARVKVLAELVEHHIEEEESELFKAFKKVATDEDRVELADQFLELKSNYAANENSSRAAQEEGEEIRA
jgi:hemerythrin superfamily protein